MHRLGLLILLLMPLWCLANKGGGHPVIIGGINLTELQLGDSDPYGDFKTLAIPIKRAGNLLIVEAQIDSVAGNFVLDTGAPYLVLNETYFRDLTHIVEQEAGGINGRTSSTFTTVVHNFSLGFDLHFDRLVADVTDLSGIENSKKIKILGLLGTRLFNKLAITIDMANNLLYIHKLDSKGDIINDQRNLKNPDLQVPFQLMHDVILLKAKITDKTVWLAFDSGAETNMIDLHVHKKVLKSLEILNRSSVTGVGGTKYELIYARCNNLEIGNKTFTGNHVLVSNLENIGKAYGYSVDGILGYDFFARGVFTINFAKKEFEMYIYNHQQDK